MLMDDAALRAYIGLREYNKVTGRPRTGTCAHKEGVPYRPSYGEDTLSYGI